MPIVAIGRTLRGRRLHDGVLADVAPTLLELLGLPVWPDVTGRSLLEPSAVAPLPTPGPGRSA